MNRFVKIIMAFVLSLSLSMLPQNVLNVIAVGDVQSISSSNSIRRLIPTNDDSDFPLSIYADIADNSIKYDELEEPVYASTRAAGANILLSKTTSGFSGTKISDLKIVVVYN